MITNPMFTIKEPVSVGSQIYQYLKESIITCEIAPGVTLSEKAISSSLQVSRQPVREAFIKLAECGLLKIYPQRGSVVTRIHVKSVLDGKFVRSAIECAVVNNLAETISPHQLDYLRTLTGRQQQAASESRYLDFLREDDAFHREMAIQADCLLAWDTINNLKSSMDRVRFLDIKRDGTMYGVVDEHWRLIEALADKNADLARSLLASHLGNFPDVIHDLLLTQPDWFETEV